MTSTFHTICAAKNSIAVGTIYNGAGWKDDNVEKKWALKDLKDDIIYYVRQMSESFTKVHEASTDPWHQVSYKLRMMEVMGHFFICMLKNAYCKK